MTNPLVGKLQAIGTWWLFGLPAIIYLILAAWTELGLPFPTEWFQVPQVTRFDGFGDDNIFPLREPFRHIASPVVIVAIVIGLSSSLIRALRPLSPLILTSLVVVAYAAFLCIQPRLPFQLRKQPYRGVRPGGG